MKNNGTPRHHHHLLTSGLRVTRGALAVSLCLMAGIGACDQDEGRLEDRTPVDQDRIVGGEGVDIANVPWQVSIRIKSNGAHFCGGVIVDDDAILTAAHCFQWFGPGHVEVVAGASKRSEFDANGQTRSVSRIDIFPGYEKASEGKDVALLHLSQPLDLGPKVQAIAIATEDDLQWTEPGLESMVSGWGRLESGGSKPNELQWVVVPLISNEDAAEAYDKPITDDQIAAGLLGVGGKDACQADSGGPLVVDSDQGPLLAGVVSWGIGCAHPDYPGMYARVSSFADWILGKVEVDVDTITEFPSYPFSGGGGDEGGFEDIPAGSCENACNGKSDGECWCDSVCHEPELNDCCADIRDYCS